MATTVNKSSLQTDSIWIDAYKSVTNQLDTYPNNIDLIDVDGIGENKIVVGEFSGQLSIYKGATIDWQTQLPEEINAVGQFLMSVGKSKPVPILCVANGRCIYMFQQKKKYYRIPLHVMDRDRDEQSLWQAFNGDLDGLSTFLVALNDLKTSGVKLSPYSINILMLETVEEQLQFFEAAKNLPPALQDNATCFSNICTYQEGFGALTQLVVGTEAAWLIILNELGNDYAMQYQLSDTPYKIVTRGALSKDYSIYVLARNNKLIHFANGAVKKTVHLEGTPSDILKTDDSVCISFFEGNVQMFSFSAAPMRLVSTSDSIQCMASLNLDRLGGCKGLIVVGNNKLRLFDSSGVSLISSFQTADEVVSVRFGKIGTEEGYLLLMYKTKGIETKKLHRKANLSPEVSAVATNAGSKELSKVQEKPELKPPARSRIFTEQLEVEKEKAVITYNTYQKDSLKLKILIDDSYLKLLDRGMVSETKRVKIHADIEGLGPVFKIYLDITNQSSAPITDCSLSLQFSSQNYKVIGDLPAIKALLPSVMLPVVFRMQNVSPMGNNEDIKAFIVEKFSTKPIAGAIIKMPICDPALINQ